MVVRRGELFLLFLTGLLVGQICGQNAPTDISVALNDHQGAVLGWRNPMDACSGGTIAHFETELYPSNNMTLLVADSMPVNDPGLLGSYQVQNLLPYTNYTFRVRLRCSDNSTTNYSNNFVFQTNEGTPDPPSATANSTATTITLTITPPANPNGVIVNYRIELTDSVGTMRTLNTGSAATEFNITGLSPFTEYNISLQAENGAVVSLRLSSNFTLSHRTAEALPSKPLNVRRGQVSIPTKVRRRRALDTQIALQWDTPTSPNGIILFYVITFNGMTVNTTDASLFLNVMGLTPFTNYTITVAAVNGAGRGNESDVVILQTEQGMPTQPLNFIGAALNSTTIRLQWDPPTTPNGIIELYIVETTDGGGTMTNDTVSAPQTSTDFTGLSPNTTYTITVRARNGAETSSPSPSITITTSVTDPAPPSEPLDLMSSPMPTAIILTWNAPLHSEDVAFYLVEFVFPPSNDSYNATGLNVTIPGLTPETMYIISVTPIAVNGTRGDTAQITDSTTTPMLMMPMNVTATATSPTMINVQWEHPPFMNTIDHYFVSWEPFGLPPAVTLGGGMMEINCVSANTPMTGMPNCTDVMEFNITGLEEYVNYTVMVIASNDVGNSTSGTDTARTLSAIPDGVVPMITPMQVTYNSVNLAWEMIPYLRRNGPTIQYIVTLQQQSGTGVPTIVTRDATAASITGLMSFTAYEVFITTSNALGNAMTTSQTVQFTTLAAPPGGVSNIVITPSADATGATITWDAAPLFDNNTDLLYVIRVVGYNNTLVFSRSEMGRDVTVPGLAQYIRYTVTITARTTGGAGPTASMDFYTRQDVPIGTVSNIVATVDDNGLTVNFDPLTNPNDTRGNVTYTVCYTLDGETQERCETTATSPTIIAGIPRNRAYTVTVMASTAAGAGPQSQSAFIDDRTSLSDGNVALIASITVVGSVVAVIVIVALVVACIVKAL